MSKFDEGAFKESVESFYREYKRIEPYKNRRKWTENRELRAEHKKKFTEKYNGLNKYLNYHVSNANLEERIPYSDKQNKLLEQLKDGYGILKLEYPFEHNRKYPK